MLVKTLKTNKPAAFISFFVLAITFFVLDFLVSPELTLSTNHPIFSSVAKVVIANPWMAYTLIFVVTLLMSMGWNNLLTDRGVFKNVTILPAFTLVLLNSVFSFSSLWICYFLMLFVLNKLMSTFQTNKPYALLYDSGFLIGLSCLVYPLSILFFILIYVSNVIYISLNWRIFLVPVLGLLTPFLFAYTYAYYFDFTPQLTQYFLSSFKWYLPSFSWSIDLIIWANIIVILFLLSFKEMLEWLVRKNLRSRKAFYLLFAYSVCVFIGIFFSQYVWNHLLFFGLPLSVILANYFMYLEKKWWYEGAYILLILSTLYVHAAPFFRL